MSHTRQPSHTESALIVRSLALTLPDGARLDDHAHPWAQLIYATSGVMTVHTPAGAWVAPSHRAVWAPPNATHAIETTGAVHMRTLYFRPDFVAGRTPVESRVLGVSPLLRELALRIVAMRMLDERDARHRRLAETLLDELAESHEPALELRMPSDPRARRVAERMRADPGGRDTLASLCRGCGASARTIERVFQREVGLSVGRWRQRARLLHGLGLVASGATAAEAAEGCGYESPSAFIAMARTTLGRTPRQYLAAHADHGPGAGRSAGERIRTSTSLSDTGS